MMFDAGSNEPPPGWGTPPPPPPGARPPGHIAPSPYGWGGPPRDHPNGTTILVLGILSIVACGVCGPFAWVMGNNALREMDGQPGVNWGNRGNVTAGRVCGIIGSCLLILGMAWLLLWVGIFTSLAAR
ncbi:MAG: DUF4190 domain-containing protein [Ilumatobacteraceae bacterium]